jgi:hypothetical protein
MEASLGDAMVKNPKTYLASASVRDVCRLFQDDHVHAALLVEREVARRYGHRPGDEMNDVSRKIARAAEQLLKGTVVVGRTSSVVLF